MSRKKIVSLFLAVVFTLMIPMTAFATPGFNRTVFDNAQDISQSYDDMTGQWSYATESLLGEAGTIDLDEPEESVVVYGTAGISYKYDLYNIVIKYYARNWAFIDTVCVKIGNKRLSKGLFGCNHSGDYDSHIDKRHGSIYGRLDSTSG